jgi:hypothetical protein
MGRARQRQTIAVNRGLFLIRYAAAEDATRPPIVTLASASASAPNEAFDFLLHPDHDQAVLWQPNSCVAMRSLAPGVLSVEVSATYDGGSAAATVQIEPLTQGTSAPAATIAAGQPLSLDSFRVLGHVTGLGDQLVRAGQWLGGPSAPSRIEGISIRWPDKPDNLDIRYAVKSAKPQPTSGTAVKVGSFSGTRGKAMPVVALLLEMSDPGAENMEFAVDALFLGAPIKRIVGKRIIASGPTGREPLVGLRVAIGNVSADKQAVFEESTEQLRTLGNEIRVFHNQAKIASPPRIKRKADTDEGAQLNGHPEVAIQQTGSGKQQKRSNTTESSSNAASLNSLAE